MVRVVDRETLFGVLCCQYTVAVTVIPVFVASEIVISRAKIERQLVLLLILQLRAPSALAVYHQFESTDKLYVQNDAFQSDHASAPLRDQSPFLRSST